MDLIKSITKFAPVITVLFIAYVMYEKYTEKMKSKELAQETGTDTNAAQSQTQTYQS